MMNLMYSAEEVNQILFDLTLEKAKVEEKLEKIEQIVSEWNNDASHSFSDMCKINEILKQE